MRKYPVLAAAAFCCAAIPALADSVTISVTPWLAPNIYGSPSSYAAAGANAVQAEMTGASTYGTAGPTQFNAQPNVMSDQGVVTGFTSYMGVAGPTGAYANEYGNRYTFAFAIVGGPLTSFSISDLSFNDVSSDPFDALGFSHAANFYNYSSLYVGVINNPDGTKTFITSGPNTQTVDAIYGVGSGASFSAYCTGCTVAQEQEAIYTQAGYYPGTPFTDAGTYSIDGASGTGTFNITPSADPASTPEPSSLILLGTGVLGVAGAVRRRVLNR